MFKKLKEWWTKIREEKKRRDDEEFHNVVQKLVDIDFNNQRAYSGDASGSSTEDTEITEETTNQETDETVDVKTAIDETVSKLWETMTGNPIINMSKNYTLEELIHFSGNSLLRIDDTNYSRDIPFKAMVKIAEKVDNLGLQDFYIEADPTRFYVSNDMKDHVIYGQTTQGIFEAEFEVVSNGDNKYLTKTKSLNAKVFLSIPIWDGDVKDSRAEDHVVVITLKTTVSLRYAAESTMENANITELKDLALFTAKEVILRSLDSKHARDLYIPEEIHDLFPTSIEVLKKPYKEEVTVTTVEKFSTANKRVDEISGVFDWYETL